MEQVLLKRFRVLKKSLTELIRTAIQDELRVVQVENQGTPKKDLMTLEEFCSEYRQAKQTVYTKISQRKIPHLKIESVFFSRKKINDWVEKQQRGVVNE